jgi:cold shock CspA family protein
MPPSHKGKLVKWNDEKGFGFIDPGNGAKQVFLHISALKKHGRRPQIGDTIYYQLTMDKDDRIRAVKAYIEGIDYDLVETRSPQKREYRGNNRNRHSPPKRYWLSIMVMILVGIIGSVRYCSQQTSQKIIPLVSQKIPTAQSQQYQCAGKTRCSQMTSCAEATFYLQNCPGVEIDGDGDGIPCENQWCQ